MTPELIKTEQVGDGYPFSQYVTIKIICFC